MGLPGFLDFLNKSQVRVVSFDLDPNSEFAQTLKAFASAPRLAIIDVVSIVEGDLPDASTKDGRSEYQALHQKYRYRLNKLVKDGYLEKLEKGYLLSKKGRDFLVAVGFSVPDLWANPVLVPFILFVLSIPLLLIGFLGWEIIWYTMSSGVPPVVKHSFDVSKLFFGGGAGLVGLGVGVLLGRFHVSR